MKPVDFIAGACRDAGMHVESAGSTTLKVVLPDGTTWHVLAVATERPAYGSPERRAMIRTLCGYGGCDLPHGHVTSHRGPCGCISGCGAVGCPNAGFPRDS